MSRVMVLVHCTFPQRDLSTYEVSCCLALHSFKVMLWTKKLWMDGRTDGRVDYYMTPFGGITITLKPPVLCSMTI